MASSKLAAQNTPSQILDGWNSTGETPLLDQNHAMTLPAGSELARAFQSDRMAVSILSHPYFSVALEGAPSLEVGPMSLMFVRNAKDGAMVLFNNKPISLPFQIDIGPDGRSLELVSITLTYDRTKQSAVVDLDGNNIQMTASTVDGPLHVVLAPGQDAEWKIDKLYINNAIVSSEVKSLPRDDASIIGPNNLGDPLIPSENIDSLLHHVKIGQLDKVKQMLSKDSTYSFGSLPWRQELAKKLVFLALILRQNCSYTDANVVASEVLTLLGETSQDLSSEKMRATTYKTSGFVKREILRDNAGAMLEYKRAYKEQPESNTLSAITRMAEADAMKTQVVK